MWFWCARVFLFTIKKYLIKKTHSSGKRIPTRRSANAVIFYLFFAPLWIEMWLSGWGEGERRRGRTITNDERTFFLHLHQIQLNHLIKTGAWKHQHMVALNLHQGVMCSGERLHFNPAAQTFPGFVFFPPLSERQISRMEVLRSWRRDWKRVHTTRAGVLPQEGWIGVRLLPI